ncbi:TetR/AcrR family transcriptional regulator [Pedobacter cryoconitis]|uniref:TetR/AcrR family transcriptional repressor of nem operon n=1 Tax=Pedobacter cryoconitis TaxID=188932 RepID=A0A7X0J2I3_9SPHI|nr:TetR/AcrR family transcriptional regulator [Pedobacter cryoconitis]MBB6499885.1 TetR/AcrR family transcriptional repressor of nem operon [Pedobacter cryoconitis]
MKGRPTLFENKELVSRAQSVFWEKGYTATSLNDLLEVTGIGSGSFYNSFKGGKKEVFKAAILQRRESFNNFRKELEISITPLELIKDFFRGIAKSSKEENLRGCIIANTVVEMTFLDDELEAEAVHILKDVEKMFTDVLVKEKLNGNLSNPLSEQVLGRYLVTFWCGLNTLRRIYPDRKVLAEQIEMQLDILR